MIPEKKGFTISEITSPKRLPYRSPTAEREHFGGNAARFYGSKHTYSPFLPKYRGLLLSTRETVAGEETRASFATSFIVCATRSSSIPGVRHQAYRGKARPPYQQPQCPPPSQSSGSCVLKRTTLAVGRLRKALNSLRAPKSKSAPVILPNRAQVTRSFPSATHKKKTCIETVTGADGVDRVNNQPGYVKNLAVMLHTQPSRPALDDDCWHRCTQ